MKQEFKSWMETIDNKKQNTAYAYANSIDKISIHYSKSTGTLVDIYQTKDLNTIEQIASDYAIGGKFARFGQEGNGTIRNAIATFVRFLKSTDPNQSPISVNNSNDDEITSNDYNFTYEKDLQKALVKQVGELFPDYTIFGSHQEGVEYSINGKRIDVLLEHSINKSLLAVELKSGVADFRVFGQVSMYLGLLSEFFPDKQIKGVIIAGEIDESLRYACLTTDKIILKTYQMQLKLND